MKIRFYWYLKSQKQPILSIFSLFVTCCKANPYFVPKAWYV
jgi:hypothetical protein